MTKPCVTEKYFSFGAINIDVGRAHINAEEDYFDFDGVVVKAAGARTKTYGTHGCTCVACGREGTWFSADCNLAEPRLRAWYDDPYSNPPPPIHMNLYGRDEDTGKIFMITSDHVVPKSLGGHDGVANRVPLCDSCNLKKGNDPDWLVDLPKDGQGNLIHRPDRQTYEVKKNNGKRYRKNSKRRTATSGSNPQVATT